MVRRCLCGGTRLGRLSHRAMRPLDLFRKLHDLLAGDAADGIAAVAPGRLCRGWGETTAISRKRPWAARRTGRSRPTHENQSIAASGGLQQGRKAAAGNDLDAATRIRRAKRGVGRLTEVFQASGDTRRHRPYRKRRSESRPATAPRRTRIRGQRFVADDVSERPRADVRIGRDDAHLRVARWLPGSATSLRSRRCNLSKIAPML